MKNNDFKLKALKAYNLKKTMELPKPFKPIGAVASKNPFPSQPNVMNAPVYPKLK